MAIEWALQGHAYCVRSLLQLKRHRTSSAVSRHPRAPAASLTCLAFLAPGIGKAPLHSVQLMATWMHQKQHNVILSISSLSSEALIYDHG